jgi:hypothetical protein
VQPTQEKTANEVLEEFGRWFADSFKNSSAEEVSTAIHIELYNGKHASTLLYILPLLMLLQISTFVRENTLAVHFENIPKGTGEGLPFGKSEIRKAAVEVGGADRDTAYFNIPGETGRKKAIVLMKLMFYSAWLTGV